MKTLSGDRLIISRVSLGDTILLYTNGRTIALHPDQAEQIVIGLQAVLSREHDVAFTLDTLELPRRAASDPPAALANRKRTHVPTLDQI